MNNATPNATSKMSALRMALSQAWGQRSPREQQLLGLGALVVALAAIWSVALAPAWRTWQEAPARQASLDAQSQRMQQLQAQAKTLQKPSPITRTEALTWLENNLSELGPEARISLQGERATLSLNAASPEALARWLSQARERAQAIPVQAQLQQGTASKASAASSTDPVIWRGSLVLRLP